MAVYLLRRNMAILVGQVADPRIYDTVLGWLRERPEVETVTTLHLQYVGPERAPGRPPSVGRAYGNNDDG